MTDGTTVPSVSVVVTPVLVLCVALVVVGDVGWVVSEVCVSTDAVVVGDCTDIVVIVGVAGVVGVVAVDSVVLQSEPVNPLLHKHTISLVQIPFPEHSIPLLKGQVGKLSDCSVTHC